jgi:hypothetical protein
MANRSRDDAFENALQAHIECLQNLDAFLDERIKLEMLRSRDASQEVELAGLKKKIMNLRTQQEVSGKVIVLNAAPTNEPQQLATRYCRYFFCQEANCCWP